MNFIALDFETANSNRSSICSVGLAFVENGKIVDTKHILVKPTPNYYESFNSMLHGINDKHTKNCETFQNQWKKLIPYFQNKVIVAHNASFDISALRSALDSSNLTYPDLNFHCTYRLSKVGLNISNHGLHEVSQHFNINLNHHNAESDAKACALIALKLIEKHKANSLHDLSTELGFKIGKIISEPKSYKPFSQKKLKKTNCDFSTA